MYHQTTHPFHPFLAYSTGDAGGAPAVAVVDPPAGDPPAAQVPLHELQAERARRKAVEEQNKALVEAADAARLAELSEVDRLKAENAALVGERDTLRSTLTTRDKGDLVRRHAKQFHNPEDAVALLTARGLLGTLEDDAQAEAAVKGLALEAPHLVRPGGVVIPSGGIGIEQVLHDGIVMPAGAAAAAATAAAAAPLAAGDDGRTYTYAEVKGWKAADWGRLRESNPAGYERTLAEVGKG